MKIHFIVYKFFKKNPLLILNENIFKSYLHIPKDICLRRSTSFKCSQPNQTFSLFISLPKPSKLKTRNKSHLFFLGGCELLDCIQKNQMFDLLHMGHIALCTQLDFLDIVYLVLTNSCFFLDHVYLRPAQKHCAEKVQIFFNDLQFPIIYYHIIYS